MKDNGKIVNGRFSSNPSEHIVLNQMTLPTLESPLLKAIDFQSISLKTSWKTYERHKKDHKLVLYYQDITLHPANKHIVYMKEQKLYQKKIDH